MAPMICPVCRKQIESSFIWFICDCCGNRVCHHCMVTGKQSGPYGSGYKCGQCMKGWMRQGRF